MNEVGAIFERSWWKLVDDYIKDADENAYDGEMMADSLPQSYWSEHDVAAHLHNTLVFELQDRPGYDVHVECSIFPGMFGRKDSQEHIIEKVVKELKKTPRVDILINCPPKSDSQWSTLIAELKFNFITGDINPATKSRRDQIENFRKDVKKLHTLNKYLDTQVYFCLIDNMPRNHPEEEKRVLDRLEGFEGVNKLTYFGPMVKG